MFKYCVVVEQTTCMENLQSLLSNKKSLYIKGTHTHQEMSLLPVGLDMQSMDKGYLSFSFYQSSTGYVLV